MMNLKPPEYAEFFATFGVQDFGLNLDYSVESLEIVDRMLQAYVGDFHLDDMADRVAVVGAGCYVGEILIREKLADRWVDVEEVHVPGKRPDVPLGVVLCCKKAQGSLTIEGQKWERHFFIMPIITAINICNGMKTTMMSLYRQLYTIHLVPGTEHAPKPDMN
jgi:hypothetical protein